MTGLIAISVAIVSTRPSRIVPVVLRRPPSHFAWQYDSHGCLSLRMIRSPLAAEPFAATPASAPPRSASKVGVDGGRRVGETGGVVIRALALNRLAALLLTRAGEGSCGH